MRPSGWTGSILRALCSCWSAVWASPMRSTPAGLIWSAFVNDLPLLVVELKRTGVPARAAFDENLAHYKGQVPALFHFNALLSAATARTDGWLVGRVWTGPIDPRRFIRFGVVAGPRLVWFMERLISAAPVPCPESFSRDLPRRLGSLPGR